MEQSSSEGPTLSLATLEESVADANDLLVQAGARDGVNGDAKQAWSLITDELRDLHTRVIVLAYLCNIT